jgi:hypothetical protein
MTTPDVLEAAKQWMEPCGSCDIGMRSGCTCPEGDPRVVISRLAQEIIRLRDADGLARDALRRSGYHFSADSGKPLAELIDKLNADARDAVRVCGEESARLRKRLTDAHEALTRVEDLDPDEFVTLESTIEWVVRSYRGLSAEHERLLGMVARVQTFAESAGGAVYSADVLAALSGESAGESR